MRIVWEYLSRENGRTCDFSYGGVFMWVNYFKYEYAILENTLFIKGVMDNDNSTTTYSLPIGKMALEKALHLLYEYCQQKGEDLILSSVPEYAIDEISDFNPRRIIELPDWGDYLYEANTLAFLTGKKMSKKRNHVNQFRRFYPNAIYERIKANNIDELKVFMTELSHTSPLNKTAQIERELSVNLIDFINCEDNPMIGALLKIDDKVIAYTIGDIKGDTLFIHIEKANRLISGSFEMINHAFASDMIDTFPQLKYINREDDAGEEGLRKAKLSYHPIKILKKYAIKF